jgi:hypothetical protein
MLIGMRVLPSTTVISTLMASRVFTNDPDGRTNW